MSLIVGKGTAATQDKGDIHPSIHEARQNPNGASQVLGGLDRGHDGEYARGRGDGKCPTRFRPGELGNIEVASIDPLGHHLDLAGDFVRGNDHRARQEGDELQCGCHAQGRAQRIGGIELTDVPHMAYPCETSGDGTSGNNGGHGTDGLDAGVAKQTLEFPSRVQAEREETQAHDRRKSGIRAPPWVEYGHELDVAPA